MTTVTAPEPITGRDYISHSQIQTFMSCSLKFAFRYVDGIEETSVSVPLVIGSAVHRGLELYHGARMTGDKLPGQVALAKAVAESIAEQEKEVRYGKGETAEGLQTEARANEMRMQLALYKLAVQPIAKQNGWDIKTRFVVLVRNKTPKIQVFDVPVEAAYLERTKHIATAVYDAIESRNFWPNHGWMCKGCPYQGPCANWPT